MSAESDARLSASRAAAVRLLIEDRQRLALENVALRHQLTVLKRSVKRAKIHDSERVQVHAE